MRPTMNLLRLSAATAAGALLMAGPALGAQGDTTRVSVDSAGAEANFMAQDPAMSADGRYVTFHSFASNLVSGDTNGQFDIFVHDRTSGQTTRVSVDSAGAEATGGSYQPAISADGRYVTFHSYASNLVSGDTNGQQDIFVHDRTTAQTTRVSVDSTGAEAVGGVSRDAAISADGRYVTFHSYASNLVSGDTNSATDIFVHDRTTAQTTRVSVDSTGAETDAGSLSPAISADGRYVTFESGASNLVSGDTNVQSDIFVHDRTSAQTTRVSVDSAGAEANGPSNFGAAISADGRYVTFESGATNLVSGDTNSATDIFVHDRTAAQTTRVSVDSAGAEATGGSSYAPAISADGRYVTFESGATNLVSGDTNGQQDIFVHDRTTAQTTRVSVDSAGAQATSSSSDPAISADGRFLTFSSYASNLVSGDTNGQQDIFVSHLRSEAPVLSLPGALSASTAPGASAAQVSYSVGATDAEDGALTPSCSPASGSSFPVGTTTVSCSVSDSNANQATGSFTVTVTATPATPAPSPTTPAPTPPAQSPATARLGFQLLGDLRGDSGAIIGYKLLVNNRGTATAGTVRARLRLSPGQRLYRGKLRTSNRRYWKRGRTVTWLIRNLRPGQRKVIVLRTTPARRTTSLTVTARAWADNASAVTRTRRTPIKT